MLPGGGAGLVTRCRGLEPRVLFGSTPDEVARQGRVLELPWVTSYHRSLRTKDVAATPQTIATHTAAHAR